MRRHAVSAGKLRLAVSAVLLLAGFMAMRAELSGQGARLMKDCIDAGDTRQFSLQRQKGEQLRRLGQSDGNTEEELLGESYALTAAIHLRDTTDISLRIENLQQKSEEAASRKQWNLAGKLASTVALYHHFINSDYSQASLYAFRYLDYARKSKNTSEEVDALSRLASIYFSKGDASGWNYAVDGYNKAKTLGKKPQMYVAAANMANYLFNQAKGAEALKYLQEASAIATELNMDSEKVYLDSFFGDIYHLLGNDAKAEQYYRSALADSPSSNNFDRIYARICYATFLMQERREDEAIPLLEETRSLAKKYKITVFEPPLLTLLTTCYELSGNYSKALEYSKQYIEAYKRVINEEKEREFAVLDLRNKVLDEKRKNADQDLELMRRSRMIVIISSIFIMLLVGSAIWIVWQRKKMKANEATVRQYLENLEQEKNLRRQIEEVLAQRSAQPAKSSGLPDDKQSELFLRLEELMEHDKLYRTAQLSLESTAEALGTNRTYLSQVVNDKAGQSFPAYINSFRIKEAITLLSDPDNDEPLKNIAYSTGFTTPSSFYTLFKQKTGMSPSAFRESVKKVKKDN